ncbi:copper-binding protein [Bradyrhizobium sp. SSBR45G]|uniref:copper resistance CopC/CopD family protein n=1 Tax=unclassified Bradyrhizobium TaxID=2631580 RepID=UPI0023428CCB|nr:MULTISPECIES: copper resistance protein CopC [unclassified Bradyrhizobium]GLH75885.1 copper-binding protein [Bradyrhizobium sp. SSBR45G]GLH85122.1 copper-binding protein [Bradyrhizobium sp. SSBR45R]
MLALAVAFTTGAAAHAVLVSADPADGSVLATAPRTLTLRFDEAVTVGALVLVDALGRRRDDLRVDATDQAVVIALPADLPRGSHLVSYRVISGDGHPVAGTVSFALGAPTTNAAAIERDLWRDGLIWLARLGLYVGLFFGVGGVVFLSWIGPAPPVRAMVSAALGVGIVSAVVSTGLQGLDLLGLPLSRLAAPEPWTAGAATSLMRTVVVAVAAMLAAVVAMSTGKVWQKALSVLALAGVGSALLLSGHAAAAPPEWLSRAAIAVHGMAVAFWLGALAPLAVLVLAAQDSLASQGSAGSALRRFSAVAVPVVGLLVVTGGWLAVVELKSVRAVVDTDYGLLLSIKLALVVLLVGLAVLNRYRFMAVFQSDPRAPALGRAILLECILGVAILAVVAGWRFTPPPRSLVPDTPLGLHIHGERAMFQVLVFPGRVGVDRFLLQLMTADGIRLSAKEATLTLEMPAGGIGPIERKAVLGPDGDWQVGDVPLPLAGRWHLRIDALVGDFDQISLDDEFELRPR